MRLHCWLERPCVRPVYAAHIAAGPNAIRAKRVPINCTHSKCWGGLGFPVSAVSTGFLHQLLSLLSNLFSALYSALLISCRNRIAIVFSELMGWMPPSVALYSAISAPRWCH